MLNLRPICIQLFAGFIYLASIILLALDIQSDIDKDQENYK
jgi:hypothetical protein